MITDQTDQQQDATAEDRRIVIRSERAEKMFDSGDGVRDIDLSIPEGSIFGFIGPSGSGKTTIVRMFTGVVLPTDGSVTVLGAIPSEFDSVTRSRLGYMPQLSVLYPDLSVEQNLRFLASLHGEAVRDEALHDILAFVELDGHESKRVKEISGGMQRRLSLAAALAHQPDLLFLDEPTAGIDPVLRRKFWDHFTELKEQGRTLFITTQYVGEAAYCDYVGVLADGRLLTVETPDGLRRTAFGGDLIDIEFTARPDQRLLDELVSETGATEMTRTSPVSARLVVEEAAITLPSLGGWLSDRGID
ncbi:MAG: ABC transporter ATP-binding protein, partial [Acidimicrobiia bacterium]|nr:ABC transporter ATP-binding protein [Acidimicrobiia bacterium]